MQIGSNQQSRIIRLRESRTDSIPHHLLRDLSLARAIAAAAKELDDLRNNWLNPPEWTKTEVLEFPGSVDGPWKRFVHDANAKGIGTVRYPRLVPKDADSAIKLKKRTLTNLYNERPAWLANAHRRLDEAVFAAYRLAGGFVGRRVAGEAVGAEFGAGGATADVAFRAIMYHELSEGQAMQTVTEEQVQDHLPEFLDQMVPGQEVVIVRAGKPVGRLLPPPLQKGVPIAGRGKGKLVIHSEDDDHLKDFAEYMP